MVIGLAMAHCLNERDCNDCSKPIRIGVTCLMADPTFFTVIDSYPIELIFPIRQGRSPQQVGKKGRDKGRWSVGIKFCWLLNGFCRVVAWDWNTMNVNDKTSIHWLSHSKVKPLFWPITDFEIKTVFQKT
jgi:hypothetical protein